MDNWLTALKALTAPAVLITVTRTEGSVPRKAGTRMLADAGRQVDTIGGGHLELKAVETARAMLAAGTLLHAERFPLGPRLGQCCGGMVWLDFELIAPQAARIAELEQEALAKRSAWPHLMLFGAGHVGTALVHLLGTLPCRVTWVDTRDAQFPERAPANVSIENTDTPEALIAGADAGTSFLVMTHSHALDQAMCEHILRRPELGWFGLIGSMTKRVAFERRLLERGFDQARIAAMVCPIGIPGITGKEPAVIAVAVCAQLLQLWDLKQHP